MVFIIDIPKVVGEDAKDRALAKMTPFADELFFFLAAQGVDENLVKSLKSYDFSETASYGFVHSM